VKAKKKIPAKNRVKAGVRKKVQKATRRQTWVACGFDVSMSSMAGAAVGYDKTLKKLLGPVFTMKRWEKNYNYLDRVKDAGKSHELVLDLIAQLKMTPEVDEIFIAEEEPWPPGIFRGGQSSMLKQQAEISGAFLAGLLRYGYFQVWQISANDWRQIIARDLGITIHHSKWRDPELCEAFNCKPTDSGKFRSKQWATNGLGYDRAEDVPWWPDIIESSKFGKIPRPETSTAKAVQCDDRYDALAICQWMVEELERGLK
jgi:hypothetical protein